MLLTIFYFVVVPPFAVIVKVWKDPLGLRPPTGDSFWTPRAESAPERSGKRQF